ncbi:hypothetical protein [Xylanimonas allomyrinae]|uniref:hypothetical protein n=1 Tax=Xylanimonas allomyrinae TaxID=2509459 RepID=UPI001FE39729|nr:hypothetical protein [Xylanimonas allomyrinae]
MTASRSARWDLLFADLESQFEAHAQVVRDGEIAELTRAEHASMTLADRLRAVVGRPVALTLLDGEHVQGVLRRVATAWVLLEGRGPSGVVEHLVPLAAVASVTGLTRHVVPSTARTDALGLGTVLRGLQRDRARVVVRTAGGRRPGGWRASAGTTSTWRRRTGHRSACVRSPSPPSFG